MVLTHGFTSKKITSKLPPLRKFCCQYIFFLYFRRRVSNKAIFAFIMTQAKTNTSHHKNHPCIYVKNPIITMLMNCHQEYQTAKKRTTYQFQHEYIWLYQFQHAATTFKSVFINKCCKKTFMPLTVPFTNIRDKVNDTGPKHLIPTLLSLFSPLTCIQNYKFTTNCLT